VSHVLVCGMCPLPFENSAKSFGPGIRTWQLARGIAAGGHRVSVVAMQIPGCYDRTAAVRRETVDGIDVLRLAEGEFHDPGVIRSSLAETRPDAVVGATIYGSHALVKSGTDLPMWADQFGHVMAEAQAKAALDGDDSVLSYFWQMVEAVGRRADHFSSVSGRQRLALIGELGALGRLTADTCGYEFVSVVPCAVVPDPAGGSGEGLTGVRGNGVPEDAFIVLWSGSYNVWSDARTVFDGLEAAMRREPRIHFVSTGGAIPGHDSKTYRDFQSWVAASPLRHRFHLQGWVDADRVPAYWNEADLGVLAERPIYEGLLGSKNRIIQWLGWGLPTVYNRVGDLGDLLRDEELGLTFQVGDGDGLAEHIVWASHHPEALRDMARRARRYALEKLSFEATTAELRVWLEEPRRAPDWRQPGVEPDEHRGNFQRLASAVARIPVVGRSRWLRRAYRRLLGG